MIEPPPYLVTNRLDLQHQYGQGHSRWLGLDGCPAGWFWAGIDDNQEFHFGVLPSIEHINPFLEAAELALIDIPVGLIDTGGPGRGCDTDARKVLGHRTEDS
jgi:predicted RNase H-like nuclease